ncbi:MAG: 6-bladed beta-propeller [Bacteroides sp.]|nr:6-bladed beta-propeller [Bacteroides sp.]MBO5015137.1 6-bladed beta-propeller [Bacteroidaceae bacterium]
MNVKQLCWAVMTIALAACSGNEKSRLSKLSAVAYSEEVVNKLPVVAHSVNVGGQEMTVCELNLLKDTIDLPLSYWVEDFEPVKLDGRDEALVDHQGPVLVSDNYILVGRAKNVPCKLFRRDGSFVGSVGSIGQGPGEYTMVYDMQIDEQAKRIYLLPWNAKSIFVYNLEGKYLSDIPLNKKYEKLIVPKGKFKVDATKNRVAVMSLPFNYLPVVAWVQDMEGNFIYEIPMNHLGVKPDFSNEVVSTKASSDALDAYICTFWELRQDTLYHLNMENGKLQPKFTLDFGQREISIHDYHNFPHHYVGSLTNPVQIADGMHETKDEAFFMVGKANLKGAFFRIGNDYLDYEPIRFMPFYCCNGYFTLNIEPSVLLERLEEGLKINPDESRRKKMEALMKSIDENGNNYIFIGKLRKEFGNTGVKQ